MKDIPRNNYNKSAKILRNWFTRILCNKIFFRCNIVIILLININILCFYSWSCDHGDKSECDWNNISINSEELVPLRQKFIFSNLNVICSVDFELHFRC